MKFADSVKQTANLTSTATITPGAAAVGFRTWAQAIADTAGKPEQVAVGDTVCMRVDDLTDPSKWEIADYTIGGTAQAPTLTRGTIRTSSNAGAAVVFGGPVTVLCTVPSNYLVGTTLTDYLAANPGSTPQGSDTIPSIQGSGLFGITVSALATVINKLWPTVAASTSNVTSTAAITLDISTHQRKRFFCTATPASINGPANYASVGDGFECEFVNVSGAAIPLGSNLTCIPSGNAIPVGGVVRFMAGAGVLYANLNSTGAVAGAIPGQVTGLTAGTATSTTQPLSWTAVSGATGYKVEYKLHTDSTWTVAFANNTGISCAVPGLTAAQSYDYRVTAINGSGSGTVSATVTASTAAAAGGTGGTGTTAPFTVTARADFPVVDASNTNGNYWSHDIVATGAATVVSVNCALSTSNSVPPTSAITPPQGNWAAMQISGGRWVALGFSMGFSTPTPTDYYFWLFLTDSNGITWTFRHTSPCTLQTSYAGTPTTVGSAVALVQV